MVVGDRIRGILTLLLAASLFLAASLMAAPSASALSVERLWLEWDGHEVKTLAPDVQLPGVVYRLKLSSDFSVCFERGKTCDIQINNILAAGGRARVSIDVRSCSKEGSSYLCASAPFTLEAKNQSNTIEYIINTPTQTGVRSQAVITILPDSTKPKVESIKTGYCDSTACYASSAQTPITVTFSDTVTSFDYRWVFLGRTGAGASSARVTSCSGKTCQGTLSAACAQGEEMTIQIKGVGPGEAAKEDAWNPTQNSITQKVICKTQPPKVQWDLPYGEVGSNKNYGFGVVGGAYVFTARVESLGVPNASANTTNVTGVNVTYATCARSEAAGVYTCTWRLTPLSFGQHTVQFQVADAIGNTVEAEKRFNVLNTTAEKPAVDFFGVGTTKVAPERLNRMALELARTNYMPYPAYVQYQLTRKNQNARVLRQDLKSCVYKLPNETNYTGTLNLFSFGGSPVESRVLFPEAEWNKPNRLNLQIRATPEAIKYSDSFDVKCQLDLSVAEGDTLYTTPQSLNVSFKVGLRESAIGQPGQAIVDKIELEEAKLNGSTARFIRKAETVINTLDRVCQAFDTLYMIEQAAASLSVSGEALCGSGVLGPIGQSMKSTGKAVDTPIRGILQYGWEQPRIPGLPKNNAALNFVAPNNALIGGGGPIKMMCRQINCRVYADVKAPDRKTDNTNAPAPGATPSAPAATAKVAFDQENTVEEPTEVPGAGRDYLSGMATGQSNPVMYNIPMDRMKRYVALTNEYTQSQQTPYMVTVKPVAGPSSSDAYVVTYVPIDPATKKPIDGMFSTRIMPQNEMLRLADWGKKLEEQAKNAPAPTSPAPAAASAPAPGSRPSALGAPAAPAAGSQAAAKSNAVPATQPRTQAAAKNPAVVVSPASPGPVLKSATEFCKTHPADITCKLEAEITAAAQSTTDQGAALASCYVNPAQEGCAQYFAPAAAQAGTGGSDPAQASGQNPQITVSAEPVTFSDPKFKDYAQSRIKNRITSNLNYADPTTLAGASTMMCFGGVIHAMQKKQAIDCGYLTCLKDQAAGGGSIAVCDQSRAYAQCMFVAGEVGEMPLVRTFKNFMKNINSIIQNMPAFAANVAADYYCDVKLHTAPGACFDTWETLCRVRKSFLGLQDVQEQTVQAFRGLSSDERKSYQDMCKGAIEYTPSTGRARLNPELEQRGRQAINAAGGQQVLDNADQFLKLSAWQRDIQARRQSQAIVTPLDQLDAIAAKAKPSTYLGEQLTGAPASYVYDASSGQYGAAWRRADGQLTAPIPIGQVPKEVADQLPMQLLTNPTYLTAERMDLHPLIVTKNSDGSYTVDPQKLAQLEEAIKANNQFVTAYGGNGKLAAQGMKAAAAAVDSCVKKGIGCDKLGENLVGIKQGDKVVAIGILSKACKGAECAKACEGKLCVNKDGQTVTTCAEGQTCSIVEAQLNEKTRDQLQLVHGEARSRKTAEAIGFFTDYVGKWMLDAGYLDYLTLSGMGIEFRALDPESWKQSLCTNVVDVQDNDEGTIVDTGDPRSYLSAKPAATFGTETRLFENETVKAHMYITAVYVDNPERNTTRGNSQDYDYQMEIVFMGLKSCLERSCPQTYSLTNDATVDLVHGSTFGNGNAPKSHIVYLPGEYGKVCLRFNQKFPEPSRGSTEYCRSIKESAFETGSPALPQATTARGSTFTNYAGTAEQPRDPLKGWT